ncbi:hypothetical protein [Synechococcus sp. UW179A]|uniref:hypothetical protein n=1 Tax=Synechococcus sp. UW179A TaxID=2575510 RepID=UPI000E0FC6D2|nr:hypothetical protein [Synechococcus sp. UW179A]
MKDLSDIKDLEEFERHLMSLLTAEQRQEVNQIEELMQLAGAASTEREIERYLDAEILIEDLDQTSSELYGFLRGIEASIHAREDKLREPFSDEFLIRQFTTLPAPVQTEVAENFWEVDPEIAQILNRFSALNQQEKSALIAWLDRKEKMI